ncbi:hypothetical protein ACFWYW_26825 [Nonomuraea sp. NPDC059023]|uniref:hypothetical protein n=1 Tax=unclassified Nonomuraea TaxID=2593643 RepID=UPI0036C98ED9
MIGVVGCTADASTDPTATPSASLTSPTTTATTSPQATASATRAPIDVQLNPDRVTAGETSKVWILANCPVPTGGPAHVGTASSNAFLSGVTLNPVPPATPSATPANATATPAPVPWVRGQASVSGTVKRGNYTVDVKCDGTSHTGKATLRVVRATDDTPTGVPTKAPRAGGGGTFGQDAGDDSSMPIGPVGVIIGLALAGGAVLILKRRRA